jgi:hypothetical protein
MQYVMSTPAIVRSIYTEDELVTSHGLDAQHLKTQFSIVVSQWNQRSQQPTAAQENDASVYSHLPFSKVGHRLVRYVRVKQLMPRQISLVDDDE